MEKDEKKELLNEERFQKNQKAVTLVAIIVLIIGLCLGVGLIISGKNKATTKTTTEVSTTSLAEEKTKLETRKTELKAKGITASSNYEDGEAYELYLITKALDPSFSWCEFDEYKNSSVTSSYCKAYKVQNDATNNDDTSKYEAEPYYMFGAFVIIATLMISGSIFVFAKRRSIMAFEAQQVMPVAQEGIEKMAPTIGKAGAEIAKGMAPAYGEMAKEISKGIKEGLKEDEEDK
jgi:hypothetical protein